MLAGNTPEFKEFLRARNRLEKLAPPRQFGKLSRTVRIFELGLN